MSCPLAVLDKGNCWPEDLVDEHAGEDADEDPDDGEAEHGAEAGVDRAVDHLAARRRSKHVSQRRWKYKSSL